MATIDEKKSKKFRLFRRRATRMAPELLRPEAADQMALRIEDLNHHFGEGEQRRQVLFDNDLEIARGELVIMTGPSGSGKTTLLTLVGALRTVQEGSIQVMGRELFGLDSRQLVDVRQDIGFIFQAHNLFASLTAMENVRMAMELRELSPRAMRERAEELLSTLGLGNRMRNKPGQLSGGQRQRVAICRALANKPRLILADEPTAALDKESGRDVVDLFQRIARQEKTTILLVTHDNRILDVADRIVNMKDGRVESDVLVAESMTICEFLKACPAFEKLTVGTLSEIAQKMTLEEHAAGETVIRQGDPGDKFYIIRNGSVKVIVEDDHRKTIVRELAKGDFFGERALIEDKPRSATVVADKSLELYVLGKEDFQDAIRDIPTLDTEIRRVCFNR